MKFSIWLIAAFCISCKSIQPKPIPRNSNLKGSEFYHTAAAFNWKQRDSLVVKEILHGNMPGFLKKFVAIETSITDSATGKKYKAVYYVSPDYLSVGTNDDWARVNITPKAAQLIADSLDCFLPTRKMVDDIYRAADLKLPPVPMYAYRDSTPTMYHHHLIIEGQRKGRKGLVAGIKKDVVISGRLVQEGLTAKREPRVAIYGWHQPDGKPIQPLYTGHVYWWVDYSQGIRLVYRKLRVNGQWKDYREILSDPLLKRLLCDEEYCDFYNYPY